ncbi:Beta-1,3-galactosyl-O-glycosyl-glycoprotein beta-1,6-N-acetylglucosaminyltransferase 3 [Aphelenchoides besseyi]|nr:Beta-1,3-galactosyl-O-glycosyl-glycoprotein beta-1,6-N-acetylglucosaminyltransferase 3 [Aphelenchoides besseyi]
MTKTLDDTMALISDEDDGIDGRFSKKRHMTGGRRMYVVMEVTPSVLCLLVLILLIILSYPYWPTSDRSSNPALRIVDRPIIAEVEKTLSKPKDEAEQPKQQYFVRPPGSEHLQCNRFYEDDKEYLKPYVEKRMFYKDPAELPMDCESIKTRNYFPDKPSSKEEAEFPVARARIVYMDYVLLEMELAAAYQPQNHYCFAIDNKSDATFHSRIHSLAKCFPNVIVTKREFKVDGGGHNMGPSFLECLHLLAVPEKKWKYVHLLQNHDTSLRTNLETVRILKWLNGSNDVEITYMPGGRYDETLDWSFEALKLFKNDTRNKKPFNGYDPKLVFSKGYVESTLSRAMVDFMLNELDLTELVRRIELKSFGIDELMIPTLHAADAIAAPGGFTHHCLEQNIAVQHITRKSVWSSTEDCYTGQMRHAICIFGVEDLKDHIAKFPKLFVNKVMPEFDWAAVVCWYEKLFNRSHIEPPTTSRLNPAYYLNLAHVRYQYLKDANGIVSQDKKKTFDCRGRNIKVAG